MAKRTIHTSGRCVSLALIALSCAHEPAPDSSSSTGGEELAGAGGVAVTVGTSTSDTPPPDADESTWERLEVRHSGSDEGEMFTDGFVHAFGDVFFSPDDSLGPRSQPAIDRTVEVMGPGVDADTVILVAVWLTPGASPASDDARSGRRALALARRLVLSGLDCHDIVAVGHGSRHGTAPGSVAMVTVSHTTRLAHGSTPLVGEQSAGDVCAD